MKGDPPQNVTERDGYLLTAEQHQRREEVRSHRRDIDLRRKGGPADEIDLRPSSLWQGGRRVAVSEDSD